MVNAKAKVANFVTIRFNIKGAIEGKKSVNWLHYNQLTLFCHDVFLERFSNTKNERLVSFATIEFFRVCNHSNAKVKA